MLKFDQIVLDDVQLKVLIKFHILGYRNTTEALIHGSYKSLVVARHQEYFLSESVGRQYMKVLKLLVKIVDMQIIIGAYHELKVVFSLE